MSSRVMRWCLVLGLTGCAEPIVVPEEQTPPPPPPSPSGFRLTILPSDSHAVRPGEVLAIDLRIRRNEGFEEPITFTSVAPAGVVVIFRPDLVIHREDSDLLIVADENVVQGTHEIHLVGTVTGRPAEGVVLKLTVKPE